MPCGEEQKTWRTAKRSGGTPSSLQCEIYTLFAASQCLSPMLCSSVCKLYTYPHTFRLSPEPAVTTCGVDKNSLEIWAQVHGVNDLAFFMFRCSKIFG